jgi:flagellar protein FliS|tara:strand:+ start:916 stop:1356 length:441 start_codon:yes stop_codon:yes gene_type:complete
MSNNRSSILEVYKKVNKSGDLEKSPYEIVKLVLNELSRAMEMLSKDIDKKNNAILAKKNKEIINIQKSISKTVTRSLTTIYSLQTSLDFEKGGEIATNLFNLYEFCRLEIIKGFSQSLNIGIKRAKYALDQIIEAWNEMILMSVKK